jgi:hypothetical protein
MSAVMQGITMRVAVRITGQAVFPARVFIATRLIQLAAWVLGCGVEIELGTPPNKEDR